MKTDYQKLNNFEVATVVMIMAGVMLLAIYFFAGLSSNQQRAVSSAFDMFDFHTQAVEAIDGITLTMDYTQEFYNQFYIAFTQVAVVPSGQIDEAKKLTQRFLDFSDQVASAYSAQNNVAIPIQQDNFVGTVAGAVIDLSSTSFGNFSLIISYH